MAISSAVDASAVARVVGIETVFKDLRGGGILFLPQRIAVIGQGSTLSTYFTTKRQVTSAFEAATLYGFGSPIHLAVLKLLPSNGDGVRTLPVTIYPLLDGTTASTGDITPSGTQTETAAYRVSVNNILSEEFVIFKDDDASVIVTAMTAAVTAVLEMPINVIDSTTKMDFESKWKGASANDIRVSVIGSTTAGTLFGFTDPNGGATNPSIDEALAQVGNVWETMFLNCLNIDDGTTLDKFSVFGEGRWSALVRKPMVVFTGNTITDLTTSTDFSDARKTDRINVQLVAPGSDDLPFVVAARQLARIAVLANNNPPHDYGSQDATGLVPGVDGDQWTSLDREVAVKKGSSTIEVKDGVVNVADVVTFYHPTGDPIPGYRYVVDIVKLQQVLFNTDLIFATKEWDGAPLIPDDQPTANRSAKKPKTAVAAVAAMLDGLALNAIISDPETAKKNIIAQINDQNPKRLDLVYTVQLSGNVNIISIDLEFGFFFGALQVVA